LSRKDRKELLAREEFIEELSKWGEEKKVPLPGTKVFIHCKDTIPKCETNIPRKGIASLSPNFHIHVSVSDLHISTIGLPFLLEGNTWTNLGNI
jgi:hypothetical protein